ncbi:Annexin [Daldinia grandis]|nr:Annexin [Daldinia grandis]
MSASASETIPSTLPETQQQQRPYRQPSTPYEQCGPDSQALVAYSPQLHQYQAFLGHTQWSQLQYPGPGHGYAVPPTPGSPGYDTAQRRFLVPVDTSADIEVIHEAMRDIGCNTEALVRAFTSSKYEIPWAMAQLTTNYNKRFTRDLAKDIESETHGRVKAVFLTLIQGPLGQDVRVLIVALDRVGTDDDALMDVLLCRSNADIRAISAEYKRIKGSELLVDIRSHVDDMMSRLYCMVLSATRTEDQVPVIDSHIYQKVTELQRAAEGTTNANAIAVAEIFTKANAAQLYAISKTYEQKYQHPFEEVIEKKFCGNIEDALLYMLENAMDQARFDAKRLERLIYKTPRKDWLLINKVVSLYWNRPRQDAVKSAYQMHSLAGISMCDAFRGMWKGDYGDLMTALFRERK